jgi:hypothetical protein
MLPKSWGSETDEIEKNKAENRMMYFIVLVKQSFYRSKGSRRLYTAADAGLQTVLLNIFKRFYRFLLHFLGVLLQKVSFSLLGFLLLYFRFRFFSLLWDLS